MSFMRATNLPVTSGRWADGQSTELAPPPPCPPTNSIGSIDVACLFTGNNILHAGSIFRFNSQCINYLCINRWLKMPKRVHNCVCSKCRHRPPQWEEEYTPQPWRTVNALNYRDGRRCHDSLIFKWTRRGKADFSKKPEICNHIMVLLTTYMHATMCFVFTYKEIQLEFVVLCPTTRYK